MRSKLASKPLLLKEIQSRFGRDITFPSECEELSIHIHKSIHVQISAQTLRRLFGFINGDTEPSTTTISFLVLYCGFNTLNELLNHTETVSSSKPDLDKIRFIKEFYNIELTAGVDFNYQKACGNIARQLQQDPNLLYSLAGFLSSSKVAQIFFFERHPYIDGLCTGYSQLLKLYAQEKKTPEAQLFAACLLHFGSILAENKTEASICIQQINQISINASIHPFVQARKIMANLMQAWLVGSGEEIEFWTEIAFSEERKQARGIFKEAYFPFFQFILADAFNFIGKYEEAFEMVCIAEQDYNRFPNSPIESGYYECLSLIKAIALYHTGDIKGYKNELQIFTNSEFIDMSRQYFLIQRKILDLIATNDKSSQKKNKIREEVSNLINKTGFSIFFRFISA